jgi:hypothetical protein
MKYIVFETEEIETVLEIAKGEVQRYTDMEKNEHSNTFGLLLLKTKWQAKVDTLEEVLKFGKQIDNY